MARCVLDSSAVLAWLQGEPGADVVEQHIDDAAISTVNWSEVLQKAGRAGRSMPETRDLLKGLGIEVLPVSEEDAVTAASLWFSASSLSLADRCCLALAQRTGLPALTVDRNWRDYELGVEVLNIR